MSRQGPDKNGENAPTDVLIQLSKDWWAALQGKEWMTRKCSLAKLKILTSEPRLANGDYTKVLTALKKNVGCNRVLMNEYNQVITEDGNVQCVAEACACVGNLGRGLQGDFFAGAKQICGILVKKLKETNPIVNRTVLETLELLHKQSFALKDVIQVVIAPACFGNRPWVRAGQLVEDKTPAVRELALGILVELCLKASSVEKEELIVSKVKRNRTAKLKKMIEVAKSERSGLGSAGPSGLIVAAAEVPQPPVAANGVAPASISKAGVDDIVKKGAMLLDVLVCEAAAHTESAPDSHSNPGYNCVLNKLMDVLGTPEMARGIQRSTLKDTIACLLTLLLDYRLQIIHEGKQFTQGIRCLIKKILETCDKHLSVSIVLQLELLRNVPNQVRRSSPDIQEKFLNLVMDCLSELTKSIGIVLREGNEQGEIDVRKLMTDIHAWCTALGVEELQKLVAEEDKTLRMIKEILHEKRVQGARIVDYVDVLPRDENPPPFILTYIDNFLQNLHNPSGTLLTLSSEQRDLGHTPREERLEQLEEFSEDIVVDMGNGASVGDTTSLRVSLSCAEHAGPLQKATKQLEEPRRSTVTNQDASTLLDKPINRSPLFVARTNPAYDSQLNLDHDRVGRPSIPNFNGPHAALGKHILSRLGDVSRSMDRAKAVVQLKKTEETKAIVDQREALKNKVKELSEQLASKEAALNTECKKSSILSSTVDKLQREIASIELVVHRLEDRVTASQAEVLRLNELLGTDKERSSAPARSSWEEEPNRSGDFSKGGFETGPFCIYSNEAFTNDVEFDQRAGQIVVQQESHASERDRLESQGLEFLQKLENAETKGLKIKCTASAVGEKHCQDIKFDRATQFLLRITLPTDRSPETLMMGRFVNALWFLVVLLATVELVTSQNSTVVRTTKEFSKALYDTRIDVIYLQHPLTVSGEEWGFLRPDVKRRVEIRPLEHTEDFVLDLGGGSDLAFVSGPSGELHFYDLQLHGIYRLALGGSGSVGIMNLFHVNAPQSIHIHNSICCFPPEVCTSISDDLRVIVPSSKAALSALGVDSCPFPDAEEPFHTYKYYEGCVLPQEWDASKITGSIHFHNTSLSCSEKCKMNDRLLDIPIVQVSTSDSRQLVAAVGGTGGNYAPADEPRIGVGELQTRLLLKNGLEFSVL
ncbi:hypothetical protein BSKO_02610 [Bryopsis sp. KO-2023]|nr:hypothetical protein BSKO_02610 [Bryopsis sp. KO-2023]